MSFEGSLTSPNLCSNQVKIFFKVDKFYTAYCSNVPPPLFQAIADASHYFSSNSRVTSPFSTTICHDFTHPHRQMSLFSSMDCQLSCGLCHASPPFFFFQPGVAFFQLPSAASATISGLRQVALTQQITTLKSARS